jgi:hypothetical protein
LKIILKERILGIVVPSARATLVLNLIGGRLLTSSANDNTGLA